jgi:hypothetical protein
MLLATLHAPPALEPEPEPEPTPEAARPWNSLEEHVVRVEAGMAAEARGRDVVEQQMLPQLDRDLAAAGDRRRATAWVTVVEHHPDDGHGMVSFQEWVVTGQQLLWLTPSDGGVAVSHLAPERMRAWRGPDDGPGQFRLTLPMRTAAGRRPPAARLRSTRSRCARIRTREAPASRNSSGRWTTPTNSMRALRSHRMRTT